MFIVGWVDYEENYKYDEQKELELNRDNFIKAIKGGACRNEKHRLQRLQSRWIQSYFGYVDMDIQSIPRW